jgi:acetyl esterase
VLDEFAATYGLEPEAVAAVEDDVIPSPAGGIGVRIIRPFGLPPAAPSVVFFHGGGWVIGSLDSHDAICRSLAQRSRSVIVSVDYRLAPEAPFPAAVEDAYIATGWVATNATELRLDRTRLIVAGDSAGGNLAAVVSVLARDRGYPSLCHQVLIYPVTDFEFERPSFIEFAADHFLTAEDMRWFWRHYAPGDLASDPRASVYRTQDLHGLPYTTLLTAECDPLRDQAEAFAQRLSSSGVPTALRREPGMCHGFLSMGGRISGAHATLDFLAERLRSAPSSDVAEVNSAE